MKDITNKRAEAKRLYEQEKLKPKEIAKFLNVKASTVYSWKSKDKNNGSEWLSPEQNKERERSQDQSKRELYASYLSHKAQTIYSTVSDTDNKIELLEDMINIKFSNLVSAQQSIDYNDPKQSQAESIANRTLSNMIKDYYSIKSCIDNSDLNSELSKVDLLIAEIDREAFKDG